MRLALRALALGLVLSAPALAVGVPVPTIAADQTGANVAAPTAAGELPIGGMINKTAVHTNATVSASSSTVSCGFSGRQVDLVINVKASPTGTAPTLTYVLQDGDPGDQTTVIGSSVTTSALNAIGVTLLPLPTSVSGCVKVTWTIGGSASPTFTQVYATLVSKAGLATQPVSGSVTATQGTAANFNAQVVGNVASAAADSGNPVKVGGVAHTALPTAGTDGQRFDAMTDKFGRPVTVANADRALITQGSNVTLTSTTETTLIAAGGANVLLDLSYIHCDNTSATLVRVDIRDATGGTVRDAFVLAASGGSGGAVFAVPFKQTTANNNWTVQLSGAVTDVRCTAQAVQNK